VATVLRGHGSSRSCDYNAIMQRKMFWADFVLPLWWAVAATIPILFLSWWIAYRSDWF